MFVFSHVFPLLSNLLVAAPVSGFRFLCDRSMDISIVQNSRQCPLRQCFKFCNILLNVTIGVRRKIDLNGLQQKWFLRDFPQLLQLQLLRTNISGCFQIVCFRSSSLQNFREVSRKRNVVESFESEAGQKLREKLFSKTHFVCLSSVWSKSYFYFSTRILKGLN